MPSYTYKAVSAEGEPVSGVLTAENYQVALRQLEEKTLYPVKVTEGIDQGGGSLGRRRVSNSQLTIFYGQLADLLKAGVPMLRSLDVLGRMGKKNSGLSQVVRELREDVAGGTSLGDALGKHPRVFPPLQASMVRAGEQGGFLEEVLERIALFAEKQDELRNKVVGSLIYPCILVTAGVGVLTLIMFVVVPKIREFLPEASLNVLSHIVFGITDFLQAHWPLLLIGLIAAIATFTALLRMESFKRQFELFKLRAPVLGRVFTMVAICRFARILGTMLRNGVPILQALRIAKDSAGNEILAEVISDAADSVRKGASLSEPLGQSGLFPPDVVDMLAVAEEGNNLEHVLIQVAETNEKRTERQVDLAVRVMEPLLLVAMAASVFVILMALLLPMLTMGSGIE